MESFAISCTTCGSRLRVRDASLIGQILACPKCHGMVLIAPPEGAEKASSPLGGKAPGGDAARLAVGDPAVDSEAVTRTGIQPQIGETAASPPRTGLWENPPDGLSPTTESPDSTPDAPPVSWQSEGAARVRQIGAIVLLAAVGLISAAAIFGFVVQRWYTTRTSPDVASAEPSKSGVSATGEAPAPAPPDPASGANAAEGANTVESAKTAESDAPAQRDPPSAEPDQSESDAGGDEGGDADESMGEEAAAADRAAEEPAPAEIDDAVPGGAVGGLFPEVSAGQGESEAAAAEATELPPELQQYMPLIDFANAGDLGKGNELPPPATREELRIDAPEEVVPESEYPLPAEPVDVRMRMKVRMLGIDVVDRPLDQVVRVLSQVSGVPIALDLVSLDVAGIAPDSPLRFKTANQTVGAVLSRAVNEAGCRLTLGDGGIVYVSANEEKLAEVLDHALLRDDVDEAAISAADLRRLVGEVDAQVKVEVDPQRNAWKIEGPSAARVRGALVIEALRMARQLPARIPRERTARWLCAVMGGEGGASPVSEVDWRPVADEAVNVNFDQPRAVEMILGELAREQDAAAVVDWPSAWSHGLTPEATALPWLRNRRAPQVVGEMLEPYGLEAFVAGQGVWWVGTREAYERMELVAVLPIENLTAAEALQRVAVASSEESPENVAAYVDEVSGRLIVRLPRYLVRQLPAVLSAGIASLTVR